MIISEKHLRRLIRNMIIENNEYNQNPTSFPDVYQQVVDDDDYNSNKETEDNNTTPKNNSVYNVSVEEYINLLNPTNLR